MNRSVSSQQLVSRAAHQIAMVTGIDHHDVVVILGSGWAPAVDALGEPSCCFSTQQLAGFYAPSVAGHQDNAVSVQISGRNVLVFTGRIHLYEGYQPSQIVQPVLSGIATGATTVIMTNAAGGICPNFTVGQPVLIRDHINLTGRSPLSGSCFMSMTQAYSPRLREIAHRVDPGLAEGVYAMMPGPQYETPAEITMLHRLGADMVGMSTVLETIAARQAGADVLALSLITNAAAGLDHQPIQHEDVVATGRAAAPYLGDLIRKIITWL